MKYITKISFFVVCCFTYSTVFSQGDLLDLKFIIKNETNINSEYLEFSPSFYKDNIVFITNRKPGLKYLRKDVSPEYKSASKVTTSIFQSKKADDGVHQSPNIFAEDITTSYHEGPLTFTNDGKTVYFTRDSYINTQRGSSSKGKTKLKIYAADREGNHWVNQREVPNLSNDEFNTGYPTLSEDGTKLYFASDRPGGQGGYDLYVSTKSGDNWGTPVNLGPTINTNKTEAFPFVHKDGLLFFASNGYYDQSGRSDYDVYMIEQTKDGEGWTTPANVAPINTGADDFGFILNPEKTGGYFASNRSHNQGKGEDDIYSFSVEGYFMAGDTERKPKNCDVNVVVVDDETGEVIPNAKVDYAPFDAQEVVSNLLAQGEVVELDPVEGKEQEFNIKVVFDEDEVETGRTDNQGMVEDLSICDDQVFRVTKEGYRAGQVVYNPSKNKKGGDETPVVKVRMKKLVEALNIDGAVVDKVTQRGVSSPLITIVNETTKEKLDPFRADANGNFVFAADCGNTYAITVDADNYSPVTERVTLKPEDCWEKKKIELDFPLGTSLSGARIPLNVYYDFDDSKIRSDAVNELNQIADLLQRYPYLNVTLASHTDSRGSKRYNENLSQRRATAAKEYLVGRGIAFSRITAIGYGESRPLEDCGSNCTELQHQTNRRTTAHISGGDVQQYNNPPENVDPKR